ncbi:hypothetical protein, partial [Vibrio parahaemolyticus]|uniref:hypothetical protein n=2 Tax=Vibrio parahaemolyticus TaxID=670 RepID=UPI001E4FAFFD
SLIASAVSVDAHYREKNFFGNTKNAFFLKKHAKWTLSTQHLNSSQLTPSISTEYSQKTVDNYSSLSKK